MPANTGDTTSGASDEAELYMVRAVDTGVINVCPFTSVFVHSLTALFIAVSSCPRISREVTDAGGGEGSYHRQGKGARKVDTHEKVTSLRAPYIYYTVPSNGVTVKLMRITCVAHVKSYLPELARQNSCYM